MSEEADVVVEVAEEKKDKADRPQDGVTRPTDGNQLLITMLGMPKDLPPQAQTIAALASYGISNREIARRLGMTEGNVRYYLKHYDLESWADDSSVIRRLMLSSMFERMAMEFMASLTPEDIKIIGARAKIDLAFKCARAMQILQAKAPQSKRKEVSELADALAG